MPRFRGAGLIPRAKVKSVRPSISIAPAALFLKRARASSSVVLPEPEGPNIAVTRASKDASMSRSKLASGMRQRSSMSRLLSGPEQPFRRPNEHERQHDSDAEQNVSF